MKTFVFLPLIVFAGPSLAQSLWKDSSVGMTVAEVQATYPSVQASIRPGTLHGGGEGLCMRP